MVEDQDTLYLQENKRFDLPFQKHKDFNTAANSVVNTLVSQSSMERIYGYNKIEDSDEIDPEIIKPFFDRMGYDVTKTTARLINKNLFFVITEFDNGNTVGELYKYYDIKSNTKGLADVTRLGLEGVIVASEQAAYVLLEPYAARGFFSLVYEKDWNNRVALQARDSNISELGINALGAVQNPTSNQWVALEMFHEYRHMYQSELDQLSGEWDASRFSLAALRYLRNEGIDLCPRHTDEECEAYLLKNIQTYVNKPPVDAFEQNYFELLIRRIMRGRKKLK